MDARPVGSVRERLLQAADELFYREGIYTVGIDRILEHAGVAKASLYGTFGSKDELICAYLEERARWLKERIEKRIAGVDSPRERILAVFDEFADRVAEDVYYGCPFIRACAERPLGPNPAREAASAFRSWRRGLFARLAQELGVRDADDMSKQLSLIYDGTAVAVSMDGDPAAALAARQIVERLLAKDIVDASAKKKPSKASSRRTIRAK